MLNLLLHVSQALGAGALARSGSQLLMVLPARLGGRMRTRRTLALAACSLEAARWTIAAVLCAAYAFAAAERISPPVAFLIVTATFTLYGEALLGSPGQGRVIRSPRSCRRPLVMGSWVLLIGLLIGGFSDQPLTALAFFAALARASYAIVAHPDLRFFSQLFGWCMFSWHVGRALFVRVSLASERRGADDTPLLSGIVKLPPLFRSPSTSKRKRTTSTPALRPATTSDSPPASSDG